MAAVSEVLGDMELSRRGFTADIFSVRFWDVPAASVV